ncbi:coiled-coil domain-containing protein 134-like isoform X1 [Centruroides sculpturatus]|uniref:coiled-coil domain-containing protein 134-like isoform X1 n=2 Tax=Centruroides sculpturatus TaxID=218467 RepID=UPI000C6D2E2D|nr:coiled-coil domain-containing protein 134-like isoform X1 [Centruroides sculpturatus]XP_023229149.1 coiled-coil domain-containing protein 134-like isoform X1 [Centruroides sculpturatus]
MAVKVYLCYLISSLLVVYMPMRCEENRHSTLVDELLMYKKLFKHKRADHLEAVKAILTFGNYEKQYRLVYLMIKKMTEILSKSKVVLEESGYIPGSIFPEDKDIREALAQTVENTAFFGDILLKLPDITHSILKKEKAWSLLMKWSLGWSNSTGIYDKKTTELMNLVAQEFNLTEKDPNFVNPYKKEIEKITAKEIKTKSPEKKVKKKTTKGPRLSGSRHTEL